MRRGDGRYKQPGLAQGVAFTAPRIFTIPKGAAVSVPHGTPVATVQKAAAAHGTTVTPKVIADPVSKIPTIMLFKGGPTETPGLPINVAITQGLIHPSSGGVTGPAAPPGPAQIQIPTTPQGAPPRAPVSVTFAPPSKNGSSTAVVPAPIVDASSGGPPPVDTSSGGGGGGGGGGGDNRGLIIAAVSIGVVLVGLSAMRRNQHAV